MLDFAAEQGLDRQALAAGAGLNRVDLSHADAHVPLATQVALFRLIGRETSDPGFGVKFSTSLGTGDWGLLGYALYHSATLGAALRRLVRYSAIATEAVQFRLEAPNRQHVAIAEGHTALGGGFPIAVDERLTAVLHGVRDITNADVRPVEVCFAYDRPRSTLEHQRFFRCPLRFGQPVSKIVLWERDLQLTVSHGDEQLAGYLSVVAEQVLRTLVSGASFNERVRAAIWTLLSEGPPRLEQVACALHLSARSLQRHLAEEGTSLRAEVEAIRKAMAIAGLQSRDRSIEELAFMLGYSDSGTFYRAVKRWTGQTPQHYRKSVAPSVQEDAGPVRRVMDPT